MVIFLLFLTCNKMMFLRNALRLTLTANSNEYFYIKSLQVIDIIYISIYRPPEVFHILLTFFICGYEQTMASVTNTVVIKRSYFNAIFGKYFQLGQFH